MYLIGNVDPQLAYIPYWLVNLCTTSLAPTAVSLFGSKAKSIDSTPHAQRLKVTKKDFYDAVRARLEEGIRRGAQVGVRTPFPLLLLVVRRAMRVNYYCDYVYLFFG